MRSNNKYLLIFLCAALGCVMACKQSSDSKGDKAPQQKIVFQNADEVRAFITQNLAEPIPDSYQIPEYISSGQTLEEVYQVLATRYPGFYGKEGNEYLQAVMNDPEGYLQMSLESKSIRRYYDPQSKY